MRRWLLIGNSRWHWAALAPDQSLQLWHTSAAAGVKQLQPAPVAWAAVGPVPTELERWQPQRLLTSDVPLVNLPPALGVDRALAAWGAWQQQRQPVLVADAGTALSLTLVDAAGCFLGGRLMAGGRLQLQALHQGTADLPQLEPVEAAGPLWATQTSEAMASGVARGLAAAIALAFHDRPQPQWPWQLWLTGGDAPVLMPLLQAQGLQPHHDEGLALAALVALSRPAQDP